MCISTINYLNVYVYIHPMGRLQIVLPDELEADFREAAARKFGYKKGAISSAVKDAILNWLKN